MRDALDLDRQSRFLRRGLAIGVGLFIAGDVFRHTAVGSVVVALSLAIFVGTLLISVAAR